MLRRLKASQAGFTVPELLVVVVIIIGLAAIAAFTLHPDDQSAVRRNAKRQTGVALIAQAVGTYHAETGVLPDGLDTKPKVIGSDPDQVDLCKILVPHYLKDVPLDPAFGMVMVAGGCNAKDQQYSSGYTIMRAEDSSAITIAAPDAEAGTTITLTKRL